MGAREPLPAWQIAFDVLLGCSLLAVTLAVHLDGSQSVAANRAPGVVSVLLTTLAVGPLVLRRLAPLAVLGTTLAGLVLLVATGNTVGVATIG